MEKSIADEVYSEIPKLSTAELDSRLFIHNATGPIDNDGDDRWYDDDGSIDEVEKLGNASDMDREWQRRHDQFYTIGYRDGLMAGKEASAQEGFNIGFKESVFAGQEWGNVRGVASAFASLPDGLKERLVEAEDKRKEFQDLHESVCALSTKEVLKFFHDGVKREQIQQAQAVQSDYQTEDLSRQSSDENVIASYAQKCKSLVLEYSAIKLHLETDL